MPDSKKWILSDESKAKIPDWNKETIEIIESTEDFDINDCYEPLKVLYKNSGLNDEINIVKVPSVIIGLAVNFAANYYWFKTDAATDVATYTATYTATAAATAEATAAATAEATLAATYAATASAIDVATHAATHAATAAATHAATHAATYATTHAAIYAATDAATYATTTAATYAATDTATYTATAAATYTATDAATDAATAAATYAATASATASATDSATLAATLAATASATASATLAATLAATAAATVAATDAATYATTDAATYAATYATTYATTHAATAAATASATASATDADIFLHALKIATSIVAKKLNLDHIKVYSECLQINHWLFYNGGCEWSSWPRYLSFVKNVCGFQNEVHNNFLPYQELIKFGPRFMHKKYVIMCGKVAKRHKNSANLLHNESGPAIEWRCGTKKWYINGVKVDQQIVEFPETLTVEQINNEKNADKQRIMLERMGVVKYIKLSGAKPVDCNINHISNTMEQLYEINGGKKLLAIDPSGAGIVIMSVPRNINNCKSAQKWLSPFNGNVILET